MGRRSVDKRIVFDQVQRLASQTFLGILATILNSTLLALILLGTGETTSVLMWLSASLAISAARIVILRYYQKKELSADNFAGEKCFLLFALFVSGSVWGATSFFLFPDTSLPYEVMTIFCAGGMVAGSVGTFASLKRAFFSFSIPALFPLIITLFLKNDVIHCAMGIMLGLFWFFMMMASMRMNRDIEQFLVLKYEKLEWIADLEKEIRDRKFAEEKLLIKNQQIESIIEARTTELLQVNAKLLKEIDDRIEIEKALRESERNYKELANSLPQIVFETDNEGKLTFANRNAFSMFGYTKNDFEKGITIFQLVDTEDHEYACSQFQKVLIGQKMEPSEFKARRKDGSLFPIAIHSESVIRDGKPEGMRGVAIDLTENKRVEQEQKKLMDQLNRAQKMEILGTVAGGVAHDLNNILSGIVSYPDLLLMQIPEGNALRNPILTMQKSGLKAAAIVQDLLTLTRRGVIFEDILNLNQIVSEYLRSPEHEKIMSFHPEVQLDVDLDDDLLNIVGSRVHLTKTIMNLISNAAESMPDGGWLRISTSSRYLDKPVKGYDSIEEGDYSVLTVSDFGIGIAPEDIGRIFEPFFTKKVMGRSGTGLGMAVVWGTVKDHKGYIDVVSRVGKGSSFSLYFPVTREKMKKIDIPDPLYKYQGDGESILIVDDIGEQRVIASEMLSNLGYQAASVPSGEEAIQYLQKNKVDLVILDMIMDPGMDGLTTYKRIIDIHPGQNAIIASGYSETERVREAQRLGAGNYIKKPYTIINLGQAVKIALDRQEPSGMRISRVSSVSAMAGAF